uniref:Putative secreted protein n=1 Tax=Ixodes ricinus TaxID=34613 RepID=A0A090X9F6_IXORI
MCSLSAMKAMIPTKCFLVLAMLPITCLMVQQTLPKGCTTVNFDSFHNTTNKTTLPNVLGMYCNASYIKTKLGLDQWIGIAGPTIAQMTQSAACINKKNKDPTFT